MSNGDFHGTWSTNLGQSTRWVETHPLNRLLVWDYLRSPDKFFFLAGYLRLAMFKILTSKDFWQGLWVYLTFYIPNRLWVSTFLIFPTSLCGVVVFRFAPALPPSAFRLPPSAFRLPPSAAAPPRLSLSHLTHQLITQHSAHTPTHTTHGSHTNSSHST